MLQEEIEHHVEEEEKREGGPVRPGSQGGHRHGGAGRADGAAQGAAEDEIKATGLPEPETTTLRESRPLEPTPPGFATAGRLLPGELSGPFALHCNPSKQAGNGPERFEMASAGYVNAPDIGATRYRRHGAD